MNRTGLILLQVVGAVSILPYPAVLVANIMSIAAPGHTPATMLPWVLLSLYPFVWIALYVISWRALAHGSTVLAFGLSSIPALAVLLFLGLYLFSWASFGLGMAGIGNGGLHSHVLEKNPLLASIALAGQDVQSVSQTSLAVDKALQDIDAHPDMVNLNSLGNGTPLNAALNNLSFSPDGAVRGDRRRQEDLIRLVRGLVSRGAHLDAAEASDLNKTWLLRRAMFGGPVTTSTENPLVWRIVTHNNGDSKPFNPLTDKLPPRDLGPIPFTIKPDEMALLNRATRLHGTPLYAALLDNARDTCRVIIQAGGRLSPEESRDPAALPALQILLEGDPKLRAVYGPIQ